MRRRLAGLMGAVCGLCLAVGCTSGGADPAEQGPVYGPQVPVSAPVWPNDPHLEIDDTSSRWWPLASARSLEPTGLDVVASSAYIRDMVVDGAGAVWVDVPWGLVRLDPATWSPSVWDVADDAAFASNWYVRASAGSGVWLVEQDRARLFDGTRFVRDVEVPAEYLWTPEDDEGMGWGEAINDLVEVGSELWIASGAGVARCDGLTWRMVGEGEPLGVRSLHLSPEGDVWAIAGGWGPGEALRYDGSGWEPIDTGDRSGVYAIAWDPTGGYVTASEFEVMRHGGPKSQVPLPLWEGIGEGEDIGVDAVAAPGDGTVWALASGELLRFDEEGGWRSIASPDGTSVGGLVVSGEEILVMSDAGVHSGVHRVAGDHLERVWSPRLGWPVVSELVDVVTVSGEEAWIVTADGHEEGRVAMHLEKVQVGHPDPAVVDGLPAWAEDEYWRFFALALGSPAVATSDGAIWYVTPQSVIRSGDGEYEVAGRPLGAVLIAAADGAVWMVGTPGWRATDGTLYGDGDIGCPDHWAHDLSLPLGRVEYRPTRDAIEITVTLTQAWPDTDYYVEVNTDQFCQSWGPPGVESHFLGLATDRNGAGSLTFLYESGPGEHVLNVNVVAMDEGGPGRGDPRPREIGPDGFFEITVPGITNPESGARTDEANWAGLCLLAPDGRCAPVDLPAPTGSTLALVAGDGGGLWATVCAERAEWGMWGSRACSGGMQLMRWEERWTPVAYPADDVMLLGAAPGGVWALLAEAPEQAEQGTLALHSEGRWTTVPEFTEGLRADHQDPSAYTVTPDGSICRIDAQGPTLVCVDPSLQISRTPVGLEGRVAVASDGTVWIWGYEWLARTAITIPQGPAPGSPDDAVTAGAP